MTAVSRSDALVLFGATGDLARKKLFAALYALARAGRLNMPVVGVARSDVDDEGFRQHVRRAVETAEGEVEEGVLTRLLRGMSLVSGDYADTETFATLADRLAGYGNVTHYLAIPPALFSTVVDGLAGAGLHRGSRESVENLLAFRFGNSFLEPIWDRNHVSSVQVTMAESFGVAGRGSFYDAVGAVRDVVQNHLLQVVALLAMEPPVAESADALRDEKVKVVRAMRPVDPTHLVRGQFVGYRNEAGVAPGSTIETFAALRLDIDSWRWAGVPFYVRAGKGLPTTVLEAVAELRCPPRLLFAGADCAPPAPNLVRFRLGHDPGVSLTVQAKAPGKRIVTKPVDLRVDFDTSLGWQQQAYERLLDDALDGDARRFAREDMVEQAWRVVAPALTGSTPPHPYARGTWGPAQAEVIAGQHWYEPTG